MSKKETEFDRYDRMKKMEKEAEAQKRKSIDTFQEAVNKKGGKSKAGFGNDRKNRGKSVMALEEEYDYV